MPASAPAPTDTHRGDQALARALARLAARVLIPVVLLVALLVVLVYAVFPTRTWIDQRQAIADREAQLADIDAANAVLERRVAELGTAEEIELLARRDHGLVMPGEEAYAVLPPAPEPVRLPDAWPFTELAGALDS